MSQWAEIRHQHLVEGVAKKQIARRLQLDIKTVRRAVEQPTPPVRASSPRVRSLDPWRVNQSSKSYNPRSFHHAPSCGTTPCGARKPTTRP